MTIIVLIILAGVTLNIVLDQNGIINKAKQATEDYDNAQKAEQELLGQLDGYFEYDEQAGVNAPKLAEGMIPVKWNGSNWVKADSSTNNWYNYDKQEWANAVTVSTDTRSTYLSAPVGSTISMDDIETMWVWIPRYSYTIGSEDGTNYYGKQGEFLDTTPTQALPGEIDVKFVSASTKDRGTAIDATYGRKTRAVIIMDSGHVVLSSIQPETVAGRLDKNEDDLLGIEDK